MANEKVEGILDHLDELRKRLIIIGVAFVGFFVLAFIYVEDIFLFFTHDLTTKHQIKLQVLRPSDTIIVFMKIAMVVAIACSIPVIAWQLWLFVKPALKKYEIKTALSYIPALFLFFIGGLCFGYFVTFPLILNFVIGFGQDLVELRYTPTDYFNFLLNMTLPFGVLFEMPLVMMFLTSLGILNPYALAKARKISYFILICIAVSITPPDPMSDISIALPLILLFELSVYAAKWVYKRKQKKIPMEE